MKRLSRLLVLPILAITLATTSTSKAEQPIPGQFASIWEMIDSLILQGNLIPSTIGGNGCSPTFTFGFPTMTLKFAGTNGCPVKGDIRFNIVPFSANIRLEFLNNPNIQALDADIAMSLTKGENGARQFRWKLTNGRLAFRFAPTEPLNEWSLTGEGTRIKSKTSLSVNSRVNFFDRATMAGYSIVRSIQQNKPSPTVKNIQHCSLSGANAEDPQSGSLSACTNK